jgi:hypothetical protein
MALTNNVENIMFLNINKGLFVKSINKDETYKRLTGTITSVHIKKDYFKTQEYDLAMFTIMDGEEKYILSVKCSSMYFKAMCNSMKSGDITQPFTFEPSYKEQENKSTVFVSQNGKILKWFHTRENPGDMPFAKQHDLGGKIIWDSTEQVEFWIDWCKNQKWNNEQ